jgi:WD40 repeat protein
MHLRAALLLLLLSSAAFAAAPPVVRLDRYGDPLPAGAVARLGSMRFRPLFAVNNAVAISHDGTRVASLSGDLRVWDRATGRLLAVFYPPMEYTWSVAFAPDGRHLVTGHSGGGDEVMIWDLDTGKARPLWGVRRYRGIPNRFAFSRDSKTLAVLAEVSRGDDPTTVFLFDFPSGKPRGSIPLRFGFIIEGMAFDPLGRLVVPSVGVHILNVKTGREVARLGGTIGIYSFALSPDGKIAAVQTRDEDRKKEEAYVRIIRLDTGAVVKTDVGGAYRSRMAFSADGKELYFSARKGDLVALDPVTGKRTRTVVPSDDVWRPWVEFSDDGRWVVRSSGQCLRVHDLRTGKEPVRFDDHRDGPGVPWFAAGGLGIDAAISPDGRRVATRSGAEVRLWDLATGRMLRRIPGERLWPGVRWTPDGKQVAVGRQGRFAWYDADTGKKVREIPLPTAKWQAQAWLTPDGKRVIYRDGPSYQNGPHTILDASDGKKLAAVSTEKLRRLFGLSEDGRRALWAIYPSDEGALVLRVESVRDRRMVFEQAFRDVYIKGRLLGAGRVLGIAGLRTIEAWDVARGRPLGPAAPSPKVGDTWLLTASPDGRLLVVAELNIPPPTWRKGWGTMSSNRSRVHLIETATGLVRATTPIVPSVSGASFTPDGKHLLTTSADATALLWRLDELATVAKGTLWDALGSGDAKTAFAAIVSLSRSPRDAVAQLRRHLRPARVDTKQVRAWLDDLDAENFTTREEAQRRLAALGADVEGDLLAALKKRPGPEPLSRLKKLLAGVESGTPANWRNIRAIEVLERLATPEAQQMLRELAAGHPGARRTREAKAALGRVRARRPLDR